MHEPCRPGGPRGFRDFLRRLGMHRLERLTARGLQYADEIDHPVRATHRLHDRPLVADIGLQESDLAHCAERLQMKGKLRTAYRRLYPAPGSRQRLDDIASQKARAAKNGDHGRIAKASIGK